MTEIEPLLLKALLELYRRSVEEEDSEDSEGAFVPRNGFCLEEVREFAENIDAEGTAKIARFSRVLAERIARLNNEDTLIRCMGRHQVGGMRTALYQFARGFDSFFQVEEGNEEQE